MIIQPSKIAVLSFKNLVRITLMKLLKIKDE